MKADELVFSKHDDRIVMSFGDQRLGEYVFRDARIPRPYFSQLHAPDGTQVTRNFPPIPGTDALDHDTMHPGLWLAFGDLNGVDFWRNKGRIEHVRFVHNPHVTGGRLSFAVEEKYLGPDGKKVCRGVNSFNISANDNAQDAATGTLLLWKTTLQRIDGPLTFGPQHEMGLGFRIATPLTVKTGSGRILSSHGGKDEAGNRGRIGEWWDYAGTMKDRHVGILVLASSDNPRRVWSHSRDYGFLAMNPTGPPPDGKDVPSIPFTVAAGEPLEMKFGVLLHSAPLNNPLDPARASATIQAELQEWKPGVSEAAAEPPRAVPTFECMSLYWDVNGGANSRRCQVRYRVVDAQRWRSAQDLWFDERQQQYRGSVVGLDPNTEYEFAVELSGDSHSSSITKTVRATTWSNQFPIAAVHTLPRGTVNRVLHITEGGTSQGYLLYSAATDGTTIDVRNNAATCIDIEADYVIIRGVKCRGAQIDGIRIGNHHHVVVEGCDIAEWGRPDPQAGKTMRLGGSDVSIPTRLGEHLDAGIHIDGPDSQQIVLQGNRIHHARYTANNWTQASPHFSNSKRLSTHPQGPNAIVFAPQTRGRHVIRWNDVGNDKPDFDHMFNDALLASEPTGNGLSRDCDIYGNRVSDCWDDGVEAERGDRNVRVWGNHFSRVVKCVSSGYIWEGPLYVFRNVGESLLHPNAMPEHNGGLSPFKSHPPCFMPPPQENPAEQRDGPVFVYHNTLRTGECAPAGWAFNTWPAHRYESQSVRLVSRNNVWQTAAYPAYFTKRNETGQNYYVRDFDDSYFDQDYDLHNGIITPANAAGEHTIRADPQFARHFNPSIEVDVSLAKGSPGHDDGQRLSNFNDDFHGAGPDRGAHEAGRPQPQYGTVLWHNFANE